LALARSEQERTDRHPTPSGKTCADLSAKSLVGEDDRLYGQNAELDHREFDVKVKQL
jgi:hypothetical protein